MPQREPIDLDKKRASRGEPGVIPVLLGGETFEVPDRLTVALGIAATTGDLKELLAGLFGDRVEEVLAVEPPIELQDLLDIAGEMAGGLGNLRGSTGS